MPHADQDVTARALALCATVRGGSAETGELDAVAAIAAAAVRLTMRTVPNGEPWYLATDGRDGWCWACEATGGHRAMPFDHAPGCPALALDAAIRAAGEAGQ